jgi:hypothetical protein
MVFGHLNKFTVSVTVTLNVIIHICDRDRGPPPVTVTLPVWKNKNSVFMSVFLHTCDLARNNNRG